MGRPSSGSATCPPCVCPAIASAVQAGRRGNASGLCIPAIAGDRSGTLANARPTSLAIAGHTHGGQVALPLLGRPIVPSKFGERYAAGHIVEGERHLFVTTGIGTSVFPVRFRVPPEVAVLTLRGSTSP